MTPDPFEPHPARRPPTPPIFWALKSWAMAGELDPLGLVVITMVVTPKQAGGELLVLTLRFRPQRVRLEIMEAKITTSHLTTFDIDPRHLPTSFLDVAVSIVREHGDRLLAEQRGRA